MFGIRIFLHAVRLVLGNLSAALRISAALMAVQFVVIFGLGAGAMLPGPGLSDPVRAAAYPFGAAIVGGLVMIATGLWIAVAWHRFILLEEAPTGPLPAFNGAAIGSYIVAGLIFALVLIAVAIPFSLLAGLLLGPFVPAAGGEPGFVVGLLLFATVYLPVAWVGYRISPILPSAALSRRLPLKEAWYATGTSGAAFVVLTLVTILASYLLTAPAQVLPGILGQLWAFLANWIMLLVGVSILTTIYGHYVEGRALNV
jgi:hypothetical protein